MAADNRTTTLYVVAYDIAADKRRTKIHKILSGFGHWTQYSLFECYLNEKQFLQLRQMLARHLEESEDSVRFYALCGACRVRVETVGSPRPEEPKLFWFDGVARIAARGCAGGDARNGQKAWVQWLAGACAQGYRSTRLAAGIALAAAAAGARILGIYK